MVSGLYGRQRSLFAGPEITNQAALAGDPTSKVAGCNQRHSS